MHDRRAPRWHARELATNERNFTAEAEATQGRALRGEASVVRLVDIVFFSAESGDAWILDPEDQLATCIAYQSEARPIPIEETVTELAIAWEGRYVIGQGAFTVLEEGTSARSIFGYPLAEIQRLSRPPALRRSPSEPPQ